MLFNLINKRQTLDNTGLGHTREFYLIGLVMSPPIESQKPLKKNGCQLNSLKAYSLHRKM